MKIISIYFLICLPFLGFAQSLSPRTVLIDSLKQIVAESQHDTTTIKALAEWANATFPDDLLSTLQLSERIEKRCQTALAGEKHPLLEKEEAFYLKYLEESYFRKGDVFLYQKDLDSARAHYESGLEVSAKKDSIETLAKKILKIGEKYLNDEHQEMSSYYFDQAIATIKKSNDPEKPVFIMDEIGFLLAIKGNVTEAMNYFLPAYNLSVKIDSKEGINITAHHVGFCFERQGNYQKALEYFFISWKMSVERGNISVLGANLNTIGLAYIKIGDYDMALDFFNQAQKACIESKNTEELCYNWRHLGHLYVHTKEPQKALECLNKSLGIAEINKYDKLIIGNLNEIAVVYRELGQIDTTLSFYERSLSIAIKTGDKLEQAITQLEIANYYLLKNDYNKALKYTHNSYDLGKKIGDASILNRGSYLLYRIYKSKGNHLKSLQYLEENATLRDSIGSARNQKELFRQESQYEYEKKAAADSLEAFKEQQIIQSQLAIQTQRFRVVGVSLLILVLFLGGLIYFYFLLRKANKKTEEQAEELKVLDKVKSNFFANISHELRTPLTLILGPLSYILDNPDALEEPEVRNQLSVMQRNGKNLMHLIEEILDLSKLEANKLELNEVATSVVEFVEYIFFLFEPQFENLGLDYNLIVQVEGHRHVRMDRNKMEKVLNNFISNAIKFSEQGDKITLKVIEEDNYIKFSIMDSGKGIHENDLPHIFDRFYQSKQVDQKLYGGTGIGLALVKEFANLMEGEVYAESTLGVGSSFYFNLPIKYAEKSKPVIVNVTDQELEEEINLANHKFMILVVEDNNDMRNFIFQLLQDKYETVLVAKNGTKALQIIEEHGTEINLVVSDVMMPEMDGLTLVKKVKESEKWFSIPFIMLTALAAERDKLTALTIGVDDYLTKPFSVPELLARVHNLLVNYYVRKEWWTKSKEEENSPEVKSILESNIDVSKNQKAKALVEKMTQFIKDNLEGGKIDVSMFAKAFHVSERQLHRNLKSMVGLTPAKFIKEIQLQTARRALEDGQYLSVSEVAYDAGFEQVSSFSTIFKKRFGVSPSFYMKSKAD